jgi:outer membrane protein TolC
VLKVLRDVATAYFEMVFAQENIRVKEEAVAVARKLVKENTRRLQEGQMAPIDVTQAHGRLAEALEELLLARNFLSQRRNTMLELTRDRFDPADADFTVDPNEIRRAAPPVDRERTRAEMFRRNPSYLASLEVAKGEDFRVRDARNQMKPRVDLKASVGYNGLRGEFTDSYRDYQNRTQPTWTAGVVVNIPLGNHLAKGNLAESLTRKNQAAYNVKRAELTLDSAYDTALRDIVNASERIRLVDESLRLAKAAADAEILRLASGKTTSYNVSQALRDLSQASSRELASIVDLNKALIQLDYIVGTLPDRLRIGVR